jgi:flavin-dependent dehydrogenase
LWAPTAATRRLPVAIPADSGLYQVLALPELSELPRFRQSLEDCYLEYVRRCDPVARALSGARRAGQLFGMLRWEGFFREAAGPGWGLVGDAGHFKDPSPGQGIQDAFRRLAGATARLLARGGCDRRALLGEVGALIAQDVRRKRLARQPHYVPLEMSVDAGLTEAEDDDAGGPR